MIELTVYFFAGIGVSTLVLLLYLIVRDTVYDLTRHERWARNSATERVHRAQWHWSKGRRHGGQRRVECSVVYCNGDLPDYFVRPRRRAALSKRSDAQRARREW